MTFDPSKPVAAKHGRPVRILASDLKSGCPIVAAHTEQDGREAPYMHYSDGSYIHNSLPIYDLYNVPERVVLVRHVKLNRDGFVLFDPRVAQENVRFTFEGDKLVAVELIGDE